jgi:hypothetical protein
VRIVTLAPEWPQAPRYIEFITAEGVVASIGHTNATAQQIADAVARAPRFQRISATARTPSCAGIPTTFGNNSPKTV